MEKDNRIVVYCKNEEAKEVVLAKINRKGEIMCFYYAGSRDVNTLREELVADHIFMWSLNDNTSAELFDNIMQSIVNTPILQPKDIIQVYTKR